jgi:uncharacterized delta-60 repeat protein
MKTNIHHSLVVFVLLTSFAASSSLALANPGDLDTSFAGTGESRLGFGGGYDAGHAVAVQADGKLVMAGFSEANYPYGVPVFSLVRFTTNNGLDASFGQGGKVMTTVNLGAPPNAGAGANAVQIQADGKILAAGYAYDDGTNSDFTLARYNPDGSLDTNFGPDATGIVYTDFGVATAINAMVIQSDGKIVAAGNIVVDFNGGGGGFALARYLTNGALDVSFGSGGTQTVPDSTGYSTAHGVTIDPDGNILVVGTGIGSGDTGVDFAIYRFTTNGVLDDSFSGGTGEVFTRIGLNTYDTDQNSANAVAIQIGNREINSPDKIVVAGYHANYDTEQTVFAIVRYTLDGSLDTSFGNGGIVTNPISGPTDYGEAVVVQGTLFQPREITVGGWGSGGFELARYTVAGALDTTFGSNGTGKVTLPFGPGADAEVYGMAIQSGEFVLAGYEGVYQHSYDFAAARFTSGGVVDTNFGNGGVLTANFTDLASQAQGVAIQSDGRIVLAGSANNSTNNVFALARYNPDGSLDPGFGLSGKVTTPVGTNDSIANAVQIQTDGKIVAAGTGNGDFAVARYTTNGSLDTSFGSAGKAITAPAGAANAMAIQPDGKIIVAGTRNGHYSLARYTTNGAPDNSFGGGGSVSTAIGDTDAAQAVRVQTDGKIVAAGTSVTGSSYDFSLVRYNTNGSLDISFGSFGRVTTDFESGNAGFGYGLAIQPDGRLIVVGGVEIPATPGGSVYFALARYATNGTLDSSFGDGGQVITQVEFDDAYATAVTLQPDGKIIAAGQSEIGTNEQYAVVRYYTDGSLDNSYGVGGESVVSFNDGGDDTGTAVALDSEGRAVMAGNAGGLFGVARFLGDPLPAPNLDISLTAPNTVVVSWPSTGGILQQNSNLAANTWTTSGYPGTTFGGTNCVTITPPAGNLFFRLTNP